MTVGLAAFNLGITMKNSAPAKRPNEHSAAFKREELYLVMKNELLSLHASLELYDVLSRILQDATRIAKSEATSLLLVDENTGDLVFTIPTGPAAATLTDLRIKKGMGIAGWVAENGKPLLVPDVTGEPRFNRNMDKLTGFKTRSLLAVPLQVNGKVIGVLEAANKQEGLTFTKDDVLLFTIFSDHAAFAIENARLHQALKTQAKATARKQVNIVNAEKDRSLERLSAGIAHDFKNIINTITGFAEIVMLDLQDNQVRDDISEILKASDSAMDLVDQILTFTHQGRQKKTSLSSQKILKQAIKLFRIFLPETVAIRGNLEFQECLIHADPRQIHQVFTKLMKNARDAIGNKDGVLNVESSLVELSRDQVLVYPGLEPGWFIKISISDNGCGMDQETLKKIFDPYFTTKSGGFGTGMSLSTVRSIVKDHGGAISISSVPGEGTWVEILFPKIIARIDSDHLTIEQLPKGSESVLVVDDDQTVALTLCKMLNLLGYQTTRVNSSEEALTIYRNDPDSIDLLITDWAMPGLTGDRLAEKIIGIRPDARVIIYSAFSGELDRVKFRADGISDTLEKPISLDKLASTVRIVLDKS